MQVMQFMLPAPQENTFMTKSQSYAMKTRQRWKKHNPWQVLFNHTYHTDGQAAKLIQITSLTKIMQSLS
ncbi:hypothetical protein CUN85_07935 [Methanolobus halotolerans]|uniref:Uncharacterized protein n=1 Tax=Methanolobus halotolerans TaxID=2052935 RepID=A0A4E0PUR3_9EURY|nr:hypothetical protein CUN85_07935 [Methanolobus halotolerans]